MAATADSSSSHHTAGSMGFSGDNNSPNFRRSNLNPPWVQVLIGDSESMQSVHQSPPSVSSSLSSPGASAPEQPPLPVDSPSKSAQSPPPAENVSTVESSNAEDSNAGPRAKKPAWNKLSDGLADGGSVMDAVSWPALSESARGSPKLPSDPPPKPASDGSLSTPQKQASNNATTSSSSNQAMAARQRSTKVSGTGGGPGRGGFSRPPPQLQSPPPYPVTPAPQNTYGTMLRGVPGPSLAEPSFQGNSWDARHLGFRSQPFSVNDHRNSSIRGNFGPHPRGDGLHRNNYGGRRSQDRGGNPNARDSRMPPQQQRSSPRGFMTPTTTYNTPFIPPQLVSSFGYPMVFTEPPYFHTYSVEHFRMPPPMVFPAADYQHLSTMLINQIEYYFSDANLVRDHFLRSKMDDQGWVPVHVIANFPRVMKLTDNIQLILDSLRTSSLVEVQGDKLRRRNEWMRWIHNPRRQATDAGSQSPSEPSVNVLATSFANIRVEEAGSSQNQMINEQDSESKAFAESRPTGFSGHSQFPNGDIPQTSDSKN